MRSFLIITFLSISLFSQEKMDTISYEMKRKSVIDVGLKAYFSNDTFTLKNKTKKLFNLYKVNKDSLALAKYYHFKALYHKILYKNDSAYYYYNESRNVSKLLNDSLEVGRRLLGVAVLQRESRDFLGSEVSSIEALRFLKSLDIMKSSNFLESIYNNLGIVSEELNQKKEAMTYYNVALELNKIRKNKKGYLYTINNIGLLYQRLNEHKTAIKYFKEGLNFDSIKTKYPSNYALLLENLAASNFLSGDKINVLNQYNEVLKIRDSLKDFREISTTHINICIYHRENKNFSLAKQHAAKALEYAKISHNNRRWLEALEELSGLSSGEETKQYFKEYIQLNDSLLKKERTLKNQFAKIRYETDKKEKEIVVLQTENGKKQEEITRQKQQKIVGWLLAAISLLVALLVLLMYVFKRKKIRYQAQLQKNKAQYEERDRIAKELHDGILGKLFGVRVGLGFLNHTNKEIQEKQAYFLNELQHIEKEIREVSHELTYSANANTETYRESIEKLIQEKSSQGNFQYTLEISPKIKWTEISDQIKINSYRILQELLHNIVKHAKAKNIRVQIKLAQSELILEIEDDGVGFDSEKEQEGIGILNILSRVNKLKGVCKFESTIKKGTKVLIKIPLNLDK